MSSMENWAFVAEKPKGVWLFGNEVWCRITVLPDSRHLVEMIEDVDFKTRSVSAIVDITCVIVDQEGPDWFEARVTVGSGGVLPVPPLERLDGSRLVSAAMAIRLYRAVLIAQPPKM